MLSRTFDTDRTPSGCSWNSIRKALLTVGIVCDWESHSWTALCGSGVFLHHLFMCFSAQTTRSPDRKSPSGCTMAFLPKPYITLSYKLRQLPPLSMLPCVVFFWCFCSLISLIRSSDFGRRLLLWFQLVCGAGLRRLCPYVFEPVSLCLCFILQQTFYPVMWFKQFIHHQQHLYFHPTGMSPTVCESASERLRSGLWLVIDGAGPLIHTPCLPSSSPCMARLDDSLPPRLFP